MCMYAYTSLALLWVFWGVFGVFWGLGAFCLFCSLCVLVFFFPLKSTPFVLIQNGLFSSRGQYMNL